MEFRIPNLTGLAVMLLQPSGMQHFRCRLKIEIGMSRIEQIESQIKELDPAELDVFRRWFLEFDAEIWDRQIEADAHSGKLLSLAERAIEDHKAGKSTPL